MSQRALLAAQRIVAIISKCCKSGSDSPQEKNSPGGPEPDSAALSQQLNEVTELVAATVEIVDAVSDLVNDRVDRK